MFVRASLRMRREEKPTRCHCKLYCTYDVLDIFRAILCPSSGALDYMCVFAAYGVRSLAALCRGSCAGQQGVRPGRVLLHPSSWTHTLLPCTWPPTTSSQVRHTIGGKYTHIVYSSWWWAKKCPKHVENIISAMHTVTSSWFFFYTSKYLTYRTFITKPVKKYMNTLKRRKILLIRLRNR